MKKYLNRKISYLISIFLGVVVFFVGYKYIYSKYSGSVNFENRAEDFESKEDNLIAFDFMNSNKENSLSNNLLSEISQKSFEHSYEISQINNKLDNISDLSLDNILFELKRSIPFSLSIYSKLSTNGLFIDRKDKNLGFLSIIPNMTFGRPDIDFGINLDIKSLPGSFFLLNWGREVEMDINLNLSGLRLSLFSRDKVLPSSSDFFGIYSGELKPRSGVYLSKNMRLSVFDLFLDFFAGVRDLPENVYKDIYLLSFNSKNTLENGIDFILRLNYFGENIGNERKNYSIPDLEHNGVFSIETKLENKNSYFLFEFAFLTEKIKLEKDVESIDMKTIPFMKISRKDIAFLICSEFSLWGSNISVGIFEHGPKFINEYGDKNRKFFLNSISNYNENSGYFLAINVSKDINVEHNFILEKTFKDNENKLSLFAKTHINILDGNILFKLGVYDPFKETPLPIVEIRARKRKNNYSAFYQLDNRRYHLSGIDLEFNKRFFKGNDLRLSLVHLNKNGIYDSTSLISLSYLKYDIESFKNSYFEFILNIYKSGHLISFSNFYADICGKFVWSNFFLDNLLFESFLKIGLKENIFSIAPRICFKYLFHKKCTLSFSIFKDLEEDSAKLDSVKGHIESKFKDISKENTMKFSISLDVVI